MGAPPSKVAEGLYKRWKRVSDVGKYFPKDKYGFSTNLVKVGDWVETHELSPEDTRRIELAAYAWAAHKKKRVRIERQRKPKGFYCVRIILVSHNRIREFT